MNWNSRFDLDGARPTIVGTGLVALDVVFNEKQDEPIGRWAGGTCGNVLSILSWLGWSAWPVDRLKEGNEASAIRKDFKRWGVNLNFVTEEDAGSMTNDEIPNDEGMMNSEARMSGYTIAVVSQWRLTVFVIRHSSFRSYVNR